MGALTGFERIVRAGEPLAMHTWFQLGGPARVLRGAGDAR